MIKSLRVILIILSAIPLALKVPYLIRAWGISPLDSRDFVFWLAALAWSGAVAWYCSRDTTEGRSSMYRPAAVAVMLAFLVFWFWGEKWEINAVSVISGIFLLGSGIWLGWGWSCCEKFIPALILALLGCPSSSYWTEYYLGAVLGIPWLTGFEMKLLFGIGLVTVWLLVKTYLRRSVSLSGAMFFSATGLVVILMLTGVNYLPPEKPLFLNTELKSGEWLGEIQPLTELDRNFFAGCEISRRIYFDATNYVSVLFIKTGKDIHQIHPIGICLRSVGIEVLSQRQVLIPEVHLQCEALTVVSNRQKYLIYAWFSCPNFSTGNFKLFRNQWHRIRNWQVYQIMTPVGNDEKEARHRLNNFIATFKEPKDALAQ